MKRVVVAAILLLLPYTIYGQTRVEQREWTLVRVLGNGKALYIYKKKRLTKSGTIKVWTKIDELDRRELDLSDIDLSLFDDEPSNNNKPIREEIDKRSSKTLYEFNCKDEILRVNYMIWYNANGDVIDSVQRKSQWNDVVPESVGEALFKAACKK